MRLHRVASWLLCSALVGAFVAPASAQEVTYTSRTKMEFGGAMNAVMSLATRLGGGSTESTKKEYVKGRRMRTDDGESSSTIVDLENGRLLTLNHKDKTYMEISLDSMMAMAQGMAQQMGGMRNEAQAQAPPPEQADSDLKYSFNVSVDRTGESEKIAGYDAQRVLMTIEMEARGVPEGQQQEQGGRMVLLNDLWVSTDVPGFQELRDMRMEEGSRMAQGSAAAASAMMTAMTGQDPRQQAAMEKATEEMSKVEGMPVRTTMHMVLVPLDQPFDRDAALQEEKKEEEKGGGGGGIAGRLGGLLGRGRQPQPPPEPEQGSTQVNVMTMVDELVDVSTSSIPDSMFEAPEGYRRISYPTGG